VLALLSSPAARGRFRRAVSLSGGFFEVPVDTAHGFLERLADRIAVRPTHDGFANRTVEQLQWGVRELRGDEALVLGPSVGDDILPVTVPEGLGAHGHDVPLLLGATGDEFDGPHSAGERAAGTRVTDTLFRAACPRAAHARRHATAGTWLYSFEWPSPLLAGAAHCTDIPFFYDVLDAPAVTDALGPNPPAELATLMHADLAGFVHGEDPAWARATGTLGDPAREYGRPGAALGADTTGMFDPVARAVAQAC
jgi:para-nitrobenzyl esterase